MQLSSQNQAVVQDTYRAIEAFQFEDRTSQIMINVVKSLNLFKEKMQALNTQHNTDAESDLIQDWLTDIQANFTTAEEHTALKEPNKRTTNKNNDDDITFF